MLNLHVFPNGVLTRGGEEVGGEPLATPKARELTRRRHRCPRERDLPRSSVSVLQVSAVRRDRHAGGDAAASELHRAPGGVRDGGDTRARAHKHSLTHTHSHTHEWWSSAAL